MEPLTLIGTHVRLEPLEMDHAPLLLAAADEARATFALQALPPDLPSMQRFLGEAIDERARGEAIPFVVCDRKGTVVGSTRFIAIERWKWPGAPPPPVPVGPDAVEIGYTWYAERVQRTAVNTEAKLLLCTHAFEVWRVRRVTWKTDARNARSRAAILRIGAQFDGILRAHKPASDGGVRDSAYYSMLASEWPDARRGLLEKLARPRP